MEMEKLKHMEHPLTVSTFKLCELVMLSVSLCVRIVLSFRQCMICLCVCMCKTELPEATHVAVKTKSVQKFI